MAHGGGGGGELRIILGKFQTEFLRPTTVWRANRSTFKVQVALSILNFCFLEKNPINAFCTSKIKMISKKKNCGIILQHSPMQIFLLLSRVQSRPNEKCTESALSMQQLVDVCPACRGCDAFRDGLEGANLQGTLF